MQSVACDLLRGVPGLGTRLTLATSLLAQGCGSSAPPARLKFLIGLHCRSVSWDRWGMSNYNLTDITVVLDRSGSMSAVREDTIHGFNQFLRDQQKVPGEATITLNQFDDIFEHVLKASRIADAKPLDDRTFVPRGFTALLDAIGRSINETGERLKNMGEDQRPGKVVFVILTDGHENYSKLFTPRADRGKDHAPARYLQMGVRVPRGQSGRDRCGHEHRSSRREFDDLRAQRGRHETGVFGNLEQSRRVPVLDR